MTKHVFPNRQVAHVWATQTQANGRSGNGQFYFEGATLYSYRSAWPIAVITGIVTPEGKQVVVVNGERYSVTTSHHRSLAHSALHGHERYEVLEANNRATVQRFELVELANSCRLGGNEGLSELELKAKRALLSERIAYLEKCAERAAKPGANFNPYHWEEQWEGHVDECAYRIRILVGKHAALQDLAIDTLGLQSSDIPTFDFDAMVRKVREAFTAYNDPKRVKAREASKRRRKLKIISEVYTKGPHASDSALWNAYELACQYRKDIAPVMGRDIQARLYDQECKATMYARYPEASDVLYERRYGSSPRRIVTPIEWMNGANGSIAFDPNERTPREGMYPTLVRRVDDRVETSRGAEVPFREAIKLYQLAFECKAKSQGKATAFNIPGQRVGPFELRSIDAEGNCTVGCHHLLFSEMERLAVREVPALVKARYPLPAIVAEVNA